MRLHTSNLGLKVPLCAELFAGYQESHVGRRLSLIEACCSPDDSRAVGAAGPPEPNPTGMQGTKNHPIG